MPTDEMRDAAGRLVAAGKRVTPERRLLLRIIADNSHLDAAEIHEIARREQPRIGLATVYRTLKLLREVGAVRASELGEGHRHFELQRDEHVHLVCLTCGRIIDVQLPGELRREATRRGFRIEGCHLELTGTCRECRRKAAAADASAGT